MKIKMKNKKILAVIVMFSLVAGSFLWSGTKSYATTFYSEGDAVYSTNKRIIEKVMVSNSMYIKKGVKVTVESGAKLIVYGDLYIFGNIENNGDVTVFGNIYGYSCFDGYSPTCLGEKILNAGNNEIPEGGKPSHVAGEGEVDDYSEGDITTPYPVETEKPTNSPETKPTETPSQTIDIDYEKNPDIDGCYTTESAFVFEKNAIIDGNVLFTKDVFIKNGSNVFINEGSNAKFEKNIYVFGRLTNNGTMQVYDTLNCLDYNGMFSAGGNYGYGYFKNYGKASIKSLNVKNDYLGIPIPDKITPTATPTEIPTATPTPSPTPEPIPTATITSTPTPTVTPTNEPTEKPTLVPTEEPTIKPTQSPTIAPTQKPTQKVEATQVSSETVKTTEKLIIKKFKFIPSFKKVKAGKKLQLRKYIKIKKTGNGLVNIKYEFTKKKFKKYASVTKDGIFKANKKGKKRTIYVKASALSENRKIIKRTKIKIKVI